MGTYATIYDDGIVFDIIEFDILSGQPIPFEGATLIRVGEPTSIPIPQIGQKWDGNTNTFIY